MRETANGFGIKSKIDLSVKKDKHTALSELLRRRDIDIRPHTHTSHTQVALSSSNK